MKLSKKQHLKQSFKTILPLIFVIVSGCNNTGPINKIAPDIQLGAVEVVPNFGCDLTDLAKEEPMYDFSGGQNEELWIRHVGPGCLFDVLHSKDNVKTVISSTSSAYLIMDGAIRGVNGDGLACFSKVSHSKEIDPEMSGSTLTDLRHIDAVEIDCAYRDTAGSWRTAQTILSPDGEWAAWVEKVVPTENEKEFEVFYYHDRTYQFLNLNNEGRMPEEGLYKLLVRANDKGFDIMSDETFLNGEFTVEDQTEELTDEESQRIYDEVINEVGPPL